MRINVFLCLLAGMGWLLCSGCISTVDGRHRAGLPFAKDRVEGRYERSPKELWAASKDVLRYLGTLTSEDEIRSVMQANVDTRTVWVLVEPMDSRVTRVLIQARTKGGAGDQELAGHIDKLIAVRLATGILSPATTPRAAD
ncbi:MAG: hypothetical protein JXQ71_14530 [Verrucomicrobia bacterium]|nr:hypothetical protein [Verrucomicrobiota bacterium]